MARTLLFLTAFLSFGVAFSQVPTVPFTEAASHIGKSVVITGRIDRVNTIASGMTFMNMGGRDDGFTIIAGKGSADPAALKKFERKNVEVSGTIVTYNDKPQIKLNNISQIKLAGGETPAMPAETPTPGKTEQLYSKTEIKNFQVPLTEKEIRTAGKSSNGTTPREATAALSLPEDFNPKKPQRIFIVFATDDGDGAHVRSLPSYAKVVNPGGWVALAANGPVLDRRVSPEWHSTMILATLRHLETAYPGLKEWKFYIGGNSGGAKRASMMTAALIKEGYDVAGCFMGGANGQSFSKGIDIFRPSRSKIRRINVFISNGNKDEIAPEAKSLTLVKTIEGIGIKNVTRDVYEGGHYMNPGSLQKSLTWFQQNE